MWSGTSALKNIDQTLQTVRNEVVRLDSQLSQLTESLAADQRQRLKIINDIAAVRLVEIESGELQHDLTAADQQAAQILEQRSAALTTLIGHIEVLNQQIAEAELQRDEMLLQVNQSSQQIVESETQAQHQLKDDELYLAQLDKAQVAEAVAVEANQKAETAQADLAEKARPYQNDFLFMYLWENGFGTTEYNGGLFSRLIDGWVARLIKFAPARVNYWNLTEIPKRLAEHANRVTAGADEAHTAIQQLELDALKSAGVKSLEDQLAMLREALDRHDDSLEELETSLNTLLEQRTQFMAGEDEYIHRCIGRLTQALDHRDLASIRRYVEATISPTDDQLLIELQVVAERVSDVNGDLRDVRLLHDNKINKLKELEQVRRNFKNSRFDDVRSGFGNESLLAGVLGEFLQGVVTGSDLWRTIQRNQRYRKVGSTPDFGSGGLGNIGDLLGGARVGRPTRKTRGSTWHWPTPRAGGGGFNKSRSGSRGSGGFKTGGGF